MDGPLYSSSEDESTNGSNKNLTGMFEGGKSQKQLALEAERPVYATDEMDANIVSEDPTIIHGLEEFKKFGKNGSLFSDLTKRTFIDTKLEIVNMILTYDSQHSVVICKENEENFQIQIYSMKDFRKINEHDIQGDYVKMKLIE